MISHSQFARIKIAIRLLFCVELNCYDCVYGAEMNFSAKSDEDIFSGIVSKFRNVLICASDPGGAEVLSSWVNKHMREFDYILAGAALEIFTRKIPKLPISITVEDVDHDLVIATLGWQTDFELEIISRASARGAKIAIFLDHYGNYNYAPSKKLSFHVQHLAQLCRHHAR